VPCSILSTVPKRQARAPAANSGPTSWATSVGRARQVTPLQASSSHRCGRNTAFELFTRQPHTQSASYASGGVRSRSQRPLKCGKRRRGAKCERSSRAPSAARRGLARAGPAERDRHGGAVRRPAPCRRAPRSRGELRRALGAAALDRPLACPAERPSRGSCGPTPAALGHLLVVGCTTGERARERSCATRSERRSEARCASTGERIDRR
jgi:hypothetical protein